MNVRYLGRSKDNWCYYSGSGFETHVFPHDKNASIELSLLSETASDGYQYIAIYLNDELYQKKKLSEGLSKISINIVKESTAKVIKLNEVSLSSVCLKDIVLKGCDFVDNSSNKPIIGFFGDSLTCGYGNNDFQGDGFSMEGEDFSLSYAYLTAQKLKYDYIVVAKSGISLALPLYCDKLFGEIYDTVDMVHKYEDSKELDIAVINLGSNDSMALKEKYNSDKENALKLFRSKYIDLMERIIKGNPKVKSVICCYQQSHMCDEIIEAIKQVQTLYDDKCQLLEFKLDSNGANYHPYKTSHEKASKLLIETIKKID